MNFKTIIITLSLLLFSNIVSSGADIVARIDNPDKTILVNRLAIQRIFTRKITRWSNGTNISVFTKPLTSIEHKNFSMSVLGLTPFNFKRQLESQTYSGKSTSVMEVDSDEAMAMKIAQTPGAIGYINYAIIIGNKTIIIIDDSTIN